MFALATTRISILGGSTTDDWGDTVDGSTVTASGVPASILEQRQLTTTPADARAQVVRFYTGRVPRQYAALLSNTSRIRDERTGAIYVVDNVSDVANPVEQNDLRLDLRRAT